MVLSAVFLAIHSPPTADREVLMGEHKILEAITSY